MSGMTYNRIKELLAKKGKQNIELAAYVNVTTRTVSTWCTNRNQPPVEMLFDIANFLEVEAGELLTLKKDLIRITAKKEGAGKPAARKNVSKKPPLRRKR